MRLSQLALLTLVLVLWCCMEAEARGKKEGKVKVKDLDKGFDKKDSKDRAQKREILRQTDDVAKRGKKKSRKGSKGNKFTKRGEKKDRRGRTVHMDQEIKELRVFGYGIAVQVIEAGRVELSDKRSGKKSGKVVSVKRQTIRSGKFVDDVDDLVQAGDATKMRRKKGRILRKMKAKKKEQIEKKKEEKRSRGSSGRGRGKGNQGRGRAKRKTSSINLDLITDAEPVVYVDEKSQEAVKAYFVKFPTLTEDEQPTYPHMIVDEDGNVLEEWEGLTTAQLGTGPGGNQRTGRHWYGNDGRQKLDISWTTSGRCRLESANVRTIDLGHQWSWYKETAFEFDCYENQQRQVNGAYSPLNDAHQFGTQVVNMYSEWYGSRPLTNTPLKMKVHLGSSYENAFFAGGQTLVFGDGHNNLHPLVSLDVVAHEVGHGVTQESSNLHYSGESGGLNEAFCDMAGKAAERYARGWSQLSWKVGADISKSGWPLRFMDSPTEDGVSIDHVRNYYWGLDVHYSSGIYNKVFYLMANQFEWDAWDAFDLFYVANTRYWHASTTFTEGAELLLKATENIKAGVHMDWSYDHIDLNVIVNAFNQVGINCSRVAYRTWSCSKMS